MHKQHKTNASFQVSHRQAWCLTCVDITSVSRLQTRATITYYRILRSVTTHRLESLSREGGFLALVVSLLIHTNLLSTSRSSGNQRKLLILKLNAEILSRAGKFIATLIGHWLVSANPETIDAEFICGCNHVLL